MTESPEIRQDPCTRNWVVIAPQRGHRPDAYQRETRDVRTATACPFCPGHESETPAEVWRLNDAAGDWRVRVVPNKFAAFAGNGRGPRAVSAAGFVAMPAVGRHEVVIETPHHAVDLASLPDDAVRDVLKAYRARYRALRQERPALILIFRNRGPSAGTSLAHPHSQIVAMPVVPIAARHRLDVAIQHDDDLGVNLYLDILEREQSDGSRIVLQGSRFLAFQPFASSAPFETWIMPRHPVPAFGDASDADLDELAEVLRTVLGGLNRALDDPDYNYVIQSVPPGDEDREYFVWHIRIVPRLTTQAGFELGTGMCVNPSCPEETAAELRAAIAGDRAAAGNGRSDEAGSRVADRRASSLLDGDRDRK
jgi:UDPglucose--hexose-1-phosphate uridylyltransferase